MLANVGRCSFRHKLLHSMSIVGYSPRELQFTLSFRVRKLKVRLVLFIYLFFFFFLKTEDEISILTLRSLSSFPAKAKSSVVFPELGGPKSNVILPRRSEIWKMDCFGEIIMQWKFLFLLFFSFSTYLLGLIIPLTSWRIGNGFFRLGRMWRKFKNSYGLKKKNIN